MRVLTGLLLVSAVLKTLYPAYGDFRDHVWLAVAVVQAELAVACLLGHRRKTLISWLASVSLFVVFDQP
jgi:hypothetical protein